MKLLKWGYGAISIVAAIALAASFFMQDINKITQITLLLQSVGFGWICGFATGGDM